MPHERRTGNHKPWLQAVLDELCREIACIEDPIDQLHELLLWRGFFAVRTGNRICLSRSTSKADLDDFDCLRRSSLRIQRLEVPEFDTWAKVAWGNDSSESRLATIREILSIPSPQGITGIGTYYRDWQRFVRCRYGYGLPVRELDLGVALLVRTISLLGIPTYISGHGVDHCAVRYPFTGIMRA